MEQVESEAPAAPVVKQWKRWGKNRLYVHLDPETPIGWWDLQTGEAHPEAPEYLDRLTAAALGWCAENGVEPAEEPADDSESDVVNNAPESDTPPESEMTPSESVAAPPAPWVDLATNRPGESAREMAESHRSAAPVKTFLARALGVHTDEAGWRRGAVGEEKVGARLEKIAAKDPRWRVLHAIPVGNRGSDIDHLVIGPSGVFTVNTKFHDGKKIWVGGNTFMVDGTKQPYVRNSRHEAKRAGELLSAAGETPVHVHGVIVTVRAGEFTVKSQPEGVSVVQRGDLTKWLMRHGEVLTMDQVDAVFEVARRSTTWR